MQDGNFTLTRKAKRDWKRAHKKRINLEAPSLKRTVEIFKVLRKENSKHPVFYDLSKYINAF